MDRDAVVNQLLKSGRWDVRRIKGDGSEAGSIVLSR